MEFEHYAINEIKRPFRYVTSRYPIDDFSFTLTKEQVVENIEENLKMYGGIGEYTINGFSSIDELESYVSEFIEGIEKDKPHTVRYIGLPISKSEDCELVVIAKVSKSGTCYLFSNNKEFLQLLEV